jgi:hypothetical protein
MKVSSKAYDPESLFELSLSETNNQIVGKQLNVLRSHMVRFGSSLDEKATGSSERGRKSYEGMIALQHLNHINHTTVFLS